MENPSGGGATGAWSKASARKNPPRMSCVSVPEAAGSGVWMDRSVGIVVTTVASGPPTAWWYTTSKRPVPALNPRTPCPVSMESTNPGKVESLAQERRSAMADGSRSIVNGPAASGADPRNVPKGGPGHATVDVSHGAPAVESEYGVNPGGRSEATSGSNSISKRTESTVAVVSGRFHVRTRNRDRAS